MTLQIDLWQLITLAITLAVALIGAFFTLVKMLLNQHQRHQDQRFDAIESAAREEAGKWQRIEREILQLKAELPLNYVRREDYVQAVATIMAKLDAMALRFENILLQRSHHG